MAKLVVLDVPAGHLLIAQLQCRAVRLIESYARHVASLVILVLAEADVIVVYGGLEVLIDVHVLHSQVAVIILHRRAYHTVVVRTRLSVHTVVYHLDVVAKRVYLPFHASDTVLVKTQFVMIVVIPCLQLVAVLVVLRHQLAVSLLSLAPIAVNIHEHLLTEKSVLIAFGRVCGISLLPDEHRFLVNTETSLLRYESFVIILYHSAGQTRHLRYHHLAITVLIESLHEVAIAVVLHLIDGYSIGSIVCRLVVNGLIHHLHEVVVIIVCERLFAESPACSLRSTVVTDIRQGLYPALRVVRHYTAIDVVVITYGRIVKAGVLYRHRMSVLVVVYPPPRDAPFLAAIGLKSPHIAHRLRADGTLGAVLIVVLEGHSLEVFAYERLDIKHFVVVVKHLYAAHLAIGVVRYILNDGAFIPL